MKVLEITVPVGKEDDFTFIRDEIQKKFSLSEQELSNLAIARRSLDARKSPKYLIRCTTEPQNKTLSFQKKSVRDGNPIHIVGAGPAGLFAALRAIELGFKPIIIERGKDVRNRRKDLALLMKQGILNPESNYCFGEGGAGTFSDGKLYTRSNKRGSVQKILGTFVQFGANPSIEIDAHPHIGTNKLPKIISSITDEIRDCGGEIHFETRLEGLKQNNKSISSITTSKGSMEVKALILATGHSSRDIFQLLFSTGIRIEAKSFALGVRIEHPQSIINKIQYKASAEFPLLPPASYSLTTQIKGKGVYTFCMCPGGIICPASTSQEEVVVNGWSPSTRGSQFANSGLVVETRHEEINLPNIPLEFQSLEFQAQTEKRAFKMGGGNFQAPAQRVLDFISKKTGSNLPTCSYKPGITSSDLREVLSPDISERLADGLKEFIKKNPLYASTDAILVGVESRTSSPIKIPRDETGMHPDLHGLFPCGEGAGYAGGIVSAAIDGINSAEKAARLF